MSAAVNGVTSLKKPARREHALSLQDAAYEAIKQLVITCALRPGSVVSEAEIVAAVRIGRTPVHQALHRLAHDELVEILPQKGIVIPAVTLDEILNIIDVRLINEPACVRRAAENADAAAINALRLNVRRTREAAAKREIETLMELDRSFHMIISDAARNPVHAELLRRLHERSLRLWFISLHAHDQHLRVCEEHAAIAEAIARRDPDAAEKAMRDHIESFRANVTRQV